MTPTVATEKREGILSMMAGTSARNLTPQERREQIKRFCEAVLRYMALRRMN